MVIEKKKNRLTLINKLRQQFVLLYFANSIPSVKRTCSLIIIYIFAHIYIFVQICCILFTFLCTNLHPCFFQKESEAERYFCYVSDSETSPCLWVGTSLGSVIVIALILQREQRLSQPVIVSPSGMYIALIFTLLDCFFFFFFSLPRLNVCEHVEAEHYTSLQLILKYISVISFCPFVVLRCFIRLCAFTS